MTNEQVAALNAELVDAIKAESARKKRVRDVAELMLEALKIARIHAPLIRLAPERGYTIEKLDAAIRAADGSEP